MAAIREDVVKMGFDIDLTELLRLTSALDDLKKTLTNGIGDDAFDEMAKEAKNAAGGLDDVKDSMKGIKPDGIDDTVKGLKETDSKAEDATEELRKLGRQNFDKTVSGLKSLTSTLGKVGVQAGKVLAKGMIAGAAGVGTIVTKSVMKYADYEQLVGGVDTLFKDMSGTVQKHASDAYKTAGLSQNDYMKTVTSFSASLIQSLGGDTAKAAKLADMAIIDMSDNANKMGTDMSSIQDAYQGFAKKNYTMLDNLKLGYGGTQEEMKRLLADAEKLSGQKFDISSYADVVEAIHVIQEDMGIAGTTAKEASETISGSFNSMKAAWDNTLISLVQGGDDFDRCVDNLIDSAKTFGKNIMPAITRSLTGVGKLVEEFAPMIERELPTIIDTLLPPLIKAATSLVKGLIVAMPDIIGTLIDELPTVLKEVWSAFGDAFGEIPGMEKAEAFFGKLIGFIKDNSDTIKKLVPAVLGLVVAFKIFSKLNGLTGVFGGGAGGGFFSTFAGLKPTVALKGMANLAIILGGLAILAAAIMFVAPYMAELSDLKTTFQILLVIGAVGLIGSALAGLAGLVGAIPIAVVSTGLANIAIALGGFTAIVEAFGLLSEIPGFDEFLTKGGEVLAEICRIVGEMAGSIIGGIGEGVTNSLPAIGDNLSAFATSIKPMFDTFSIVDTDGLTDFATAFAAFIAVLVGEKIVSVITGDVDYEGLGTKLSTMATSLSSFFTTVMTFPDGGFEKATALFDCLAGIKSLPEDGGVVGWFKGEVDYAKMATGLTQLSGAVGFFSAVQTIPDDAFTKATQLFECLAGIKSMPKDGGIAQWFTGTINYDKLSSGLQTLASETMVGALTTLSTIPETAFANITAMFNALAGISSVPSEGGVFGWFTGSESSGLSSIAAELPGLATNVAAFHTNLNGLTDFSLISNLFTELGKIEISKDATKGTGFLGLGDSKLSTVGQNLADFATNAAPFFTSINGLNTENLSDFITDMADLGGLPTSLSSLDTTIGTALGNLYNTFATGLGKIVMLAGTTATALETSGVNMMTGLQKGMTSMLPSLVTTAQTMASAIQTAFDLELRINSPSKVMIGKGEDWGTGGVIGMRNMIPEAQAAARDFALAATPYGNYTPDNSVSTYNTSTSSEVISVSPQFNLTISGTQDDRAMARKVKQFVAEAIQETFESMERKSAVLREV